MTMDDKKRPSLIPQNDSFSEVDRLLSALAPPNENPRSSVGIDEGRSTVKKSDRPILVRPQRQKKDKRVPNYIEGYEQEE